MKKLNLFYAVKIFLFLLWGILYANCAAAVPHFMAYGNNFSVSGSFTKEIAEEISKTIKKNGKAPIHFELTDISTKEFEQICSLYSNMESLVLKDGFPDCSPIKKLKNLKSFKGENILAEDFSCFLGSNKIESLDLTAKNMGPDLSWMSNMKKLKQIHITSNNLHSFIGIPKLLSAVTVSFCDCPADNLTVLAEAIPNVQYLGLIHMSLPDLTPISQLSELKKINFSRSKVKSFSPLSHCTKLEELTYYEVKECDFSSLAQLKSVRTLNGGRTSIKNISEIGKLSSLKEFNVFSEYISDYSPLKNTALERLEIRDVRSMGDLSALGGITTLKQIAIYDLDGAKNSLALSQWKKLEKIYISGYNQRGGEPFDLRSAQGWDSVKEAYFKEGIFSHFDNMQAMSSLEELSLIKVKSDSGVINISFVKKLSRLQKLTMEECTISEFESLCMCPHLQHLTVDKVRGITDFSLLNQIPQLKTLTIKRGILSEEQRKELSKKMTVQLF